LSSWAILRAYNDDTHEVWIEKNLGKVGWTLPLEKIDYPWQRHIQQRLENSLLFIFSPSWPDSDLNTWAGRLNYWSRWIWGLVTVYVICGNWTFFRQRQFYLIPLATMGILFTLMFQNTVTMEGRYRKPAEALLLLNVAFLLSYKKQRKPCLLTPSPASTGA
jgi:hypothetical protein